MRLANVLAAIALATTNVATTRGAAPPLVSTRALLAGLERSGRAEANVRLERRDPLTGRLVVVQGHLALELPRLARLELRDGERLTLREDGGDWLQPETHQLIRAGVRATSDLLSWCGALLDPRGERMVERKVGPQTYALSPDSVAGQPAQRVELGADGLPRRVVVASSPEESIEYLLSRWRFVRPRGRADFVLEPPRGCEVVELP
jgi:hypothetical protein